MNLGADWNYGDGKGNTQADTRYHLQTSDNANIFIQTSGPSQSNGQLYLRLVFQTGSSTYYWLNNIVAIGKLTILSSSGGGMWLRIDSWYMT
jgi:hypothetical protein